MGGYTLRDHLHQFGMDRFRRFSLNEVEVTLFIVFGLFRQQPLVDSVSIDDDPGAGGLTENLPRVLPANSCAQIGRDSWQVPAVFDWLQSAGNIAPAEMLRTFNCGIGMVVCVAPSETERATAILEAQGETVFTIGEIAACECETPCVRYL